MQRFLRFAFWVSVAGAAGAFASVPWAGVEGAAGGSAMVCIAVFALAALCWSDLEGRIGILALLLGKRASNGGTGGTSGVEHALVINVRSIRVDGVFVFARDFLAYLRGGGGSYLDAVTGESRPWPDDAELFLAWRCPKASAAEAARLLNIWEHAGSPLLLRAVKGNRTVLADDDGGRLTLPELSAATRGQAAHRRPR